MYCIKDLGWCKLNPQRLFRLKMNPLIPNIKALGLAGFDKKIFKIILYILLRKTLTPGAGPI